MINIKKMNPFEYIRDYLFGPPNEVIVPAIVNNQASREEWNYWLDKIEQHYDEILNIPEHLKNKYFYYEAANVNGLILAHLPPELHSAELYAICMKNKGLAIKYARDDCLTYKACFLAVVNNRAAFDYIPDKFTGGSA